MRFICPRYSRSCFRIRNKWMIDRFSLVIAVFNGQPSGTKNTIDYAEKQGVALSYVSQIQTNSGNDKKGNETA